MKEDERSRGEKRPMSYKNEPTGSRQITDSLYLAEKTEIGTSQDSRLTTKN